MIEIGDQQQTQQEVGEEIGDIFEMAKIMGVQRLSCTITRRCHFRPATLASWSQPGWNTVKKKTSRAATMNVFELLLTATDNYH